jgi:hypothetical protein
MPEWACVLVQWESGNRAQQHGWSGARGASWRPVVTLHAGADCRARVGSFHGSEDTTPLLAFGPAPWRIMTDAPHAFLSTACHHGHHAICHRICTFCPALCECRCHGVRSASTWPVCPECGEDGLMPEHPLFDRSTEGALIPRERRVSDPMVCVRCAWKGIL